MSGDAQPSAPSVGAKFTALTPELYEYVVSHGTRRDRVLLDLERETAGLGDIAIMQTPPDQGALLTLLVQAIGARRALELGTFTGYSGICIARGLASDGLLLTCELEEERASVARRWFERAGVADRIELRVGPALETLRSLSEAEPFDFAYVDADKPGYPDYYEECLRLLRPRGLIMIDNTLLSGRVLEPEDESARAIARLNEAIVADERVEVAMLGVADGVTLALKRP
jgi:caffeoyl-CoA O-methyltransferase